MALLITLYFVIGLVEYIRLSEDFREKLRGDFPLTDHQAIEGSIVIVLLFFGFPLLIMKTLLTIKNFFLTMWKKLIFPFRLRKFAKKLNKVSDEKDVKKSTEMLFEAMKEIMK